MAEKLVASEKLFFPYSEFVFAVVGAGGNGSYLVPNLARIIGITNKQFNRNDSMIIIDKDKVENKNLARQNFILADVDKNKAKALAERYSKAFGVNIAYADEYITDKNWQDILGARNQGDRQCMVILGCVDNNKTRHILHNAYRQLYNGIYIDCGNEEYGGQVVFSANRGWTASGRQVSFTRGYGSGTMKDVVEEFNLNADDKHPDDLSCAERAMSAPQNIGTNIKAAEVMFGYCNKLIAGAANYLNSPDRNNILQNEEFGRDGAERTRALVRRAPMIGNHIVFFDSKTEQENARPFSPEVQEMIKRYK